MIKTVGTETQREMSIFTLMMLSGLIEIIAVPARKEGWRYVCRRNYSRNLRDYDLRMLQVDGLYH